MRSQSGGEFFPQNPRKPELWSKEVPRNVHRHLHLCFARIQVMLSPANLTVITDHYVRDSHVLGNSNIKHFLSYMYLRHVSVNRQCQ